MTNIPLNGRADLHMHTTVSDGIASVTDMLDHVADRGNLDVIAITDHDRLEASLWAYSNRSRYPFDIIPGLEVTTHQGHVLALWCTQPIPSHMSLHETAAAVHDQGGIAVLAHPLEVTIDPLAAWRYFRNPQVLLESGVDAIEIFNAGAFTPGCNWLAGKIFEKIPLAKLGNSDAHMPASIGTGITRFVGKTAADLRQSIVQGNTAAEGNPWSIIVYLRLSLTMIPKKLNASLATSAR